MTWQRKLLESTEATRVFITGKPPKAVHVAVHGSFDIMYDDTIADDGTRWVAFYPDHASDVQKLLTASSRPNEAIVSYGSHGWRVWLPEGSGNALDPQSDLSQIAHIPRDPEF